MRLNKKNISSYHQSIVSTDDENLTSQSMYIKRSDFNSEDDAGDSFVSVAASNDWIGWCRIADDTMENASIGDDNCRRAVAAESSHIRWMAMIMIGK